MNILSLKAVREKYEFTVAKTFSQPSWLNLTKSSEKVPRQLDYNRIKVRKLR